MTYYFQALVQKRLSFRTVFTGGMKNGYNQATGIKAFNCSNACFNWRVISNEYDITFIISS
jgi:hypothetical protein